MREDEVLAQLTTPLAAPVRGPFLSVHLGGGTGGLPHFPEQQRPGLQKRWGRLGTPNLDEPTIALLSAPSRDFGVQMDELARDVRQIAATTALATTPGEGA